MTAYRPWGSSSTRGSLIRQDTTTGLHWALGICANSSLWSQKRRIAFTEEGVGERDGRDGRKEEAERGRGRGKEAREPEGVKREKKEREGPGGWRLLGPCPAAT